MPEALAWERQHRISQQLPNHTMEAWICITVICMQDLGLHPCISACIGYPPPTRVIARHSSASTGMPSRIQLTNIAGLEVRSNIAFPESLGAHVALPQFLPAPLCRTQALPHRMGTASAQQCAGREDGAKAGAALHPCAIRTHQDEHELHGGSWDASQPRSLHIACPAQARIGSSAVPSIDDTTTLPPEELETDQQGQG